MIVPAIAKPMDPPRLRTKLRKRKTTHKDGTERGRVMSQVSRYSRDGDKGLVDMKGERDLLARRRDDSHILSLDCSLDRNERAVRNIRRHYRDHHSQRKQKGLARSLKLSLSCDAQLPREHSRLQSLPDAKAGKESVAYLFTD